MKETNLIYWLSFSKLEPTTPQGYKSFFMLKSAEHEIFSADKYENANNSWHFHISREIFMLSYV